MENHFINLAPHDVICLSGNDRIGKLPETSRVEQLVKKIKAINWQYEDGAIFSEDGLQCEILRPDAQGWQKGIIRVSIEFMPTPDVVKSEVCPPETDEQSLSIAENPLDVIRQSALQNNL